MTRARESDQLPELPAWLAPVLVAAVAVPTFAAFWIGGRPELGAVWAGVNVAFAIVIALGRRSDTIRLLTATEDDERTRLLDYQATTAMGTVLVVALMLLFLAAGVRGENGVVYGGLLLLAEATRLTALAVLNRRS
jgi:hypothetical protein